MKKQFPIEITIPSPCNQSWDEMTPAGNGRHCSHCEKTVVDFTGWNDRALYDFFKSNKGNVCGRLHYTQIDRHISIPHQPHSRLYRITIGLGLVLLFTQVPTVLHAKVRTDITLNSTADTFQYFSDTTAKHQLKGIVTDEKNEPIINAKIFIFKDEKEIASTITDLDGNYYIDSFPQDTCRVAVAFVGYRTFVSQNVVISTEKSTDVNIKLERLNTAIQGELILTNYKTPVTDPYDPGKTIISGDDITHMPIR